MDIGASAVVSIVKAVFDYISGRVRTDAEMWSVEHEEIHIYNESDKAVANRFWRLMWRKRTKRFPLKYEYQEQETGIESWEDHFIKISGKEKDVLTFEPLNDFDWNPIEREGQKLYLEIYIGKSKNPLRLHLHDVYIHKPSQVNS